MNDPFKATCKAIRTAADNAAVHNRRVLVEKWIMGSYVKRLLESDEGLSWSAIAEATGVNSIALAEAKSIHECFTRVQDIPA